MWIMLVRIKGAEEGQYARDFKIVGRYQVRLSDERLVDRYYVRTNIHAAIVTHDRIEEIE
jgi:hypothetical protein